MKTSVVDASTTGVFYIVGTPIGNLSDISERAVEVLKAVDLIACEDTRHSGRLLQHYGIETPKLSLHAHNEVARSQQLVEKLASGISIALISDAGMPGVSDPGTRFLNAVIAAGLPYSVIPGPTAVITAVTGSGFPAHAFYFGGFLPIKKGKKERLIREALEREETSVFYESPHRIVKTLAVVAECGPGRLICVARELTKKFEEFRRGPVEEVRQHFEDKPPKGEIALVLAGTGFKFTDEPSVDSDACQP